MTSCVRAGVWECPGQGPSCCVRSYRLACCFDRRFLCAGGSSEVSCCWDAAASGRESGAPAVGPQLPRQEPRRDAAGCADAPAPVHPERHPPLRASRRRPGRVSSFALHPIRPHPPTPPSPLPATCWQGRSTASILSSTGTVLNHLTKLQHRLISASSGARASYRQGYTDNSLWGACR